MKRVIYMYSYLASIVVLFACGNMSSAATKDLYVTDAIGVVKYWYDTETHEAVKDDDFVIHDEGGSDFDQPQGIVIGPDGLLYVTGQDSGTVVRFNRFTGERIDVFATLPGSSPTYMTFGPDNSGDGIEDLYVATWTSTIARIPTAGADAGTVYNFTSGGSLTNTSDVKVGPDGNLYVVGVGTKIVEKYDGTTGAFISTFSTQTQNTMGLGFNEDGSLLYTTNYANTPNGGVNKIDGSTGTMLADPFGTGLLYCTTITIGPDFNDNGSPDIYTGHPIPGADLSGNQIDVFDSLTGENIGPLVLVDHYRPKDVLFVDPVTTTPGDANSDGYVDVSDLGILATHYDSGGGKTWEEGDFTGDGFVDVSDLGILATNYGTTPTTQVVPEPSTVVLVLGLCLVGGLATTRRKTRR